MANDRRKIAFETEIQNVEEAQSDLKKLTKGIDDVTQASKESAKAEADAQKQNEQTSETMKEVAFQAGLGSIGAKAFTQSINAATESVSSLSPEAELLAGSVGRVAQSMITMGPAAGISAAALEAVQLIVKEVIKEIQRLGRLREFDEIIEGTKEWHGGLTEILDTQTKIVDQIRESEAELRKVNEQQQELNDGTRNMNILFAATLNKQVELNTLKAKQKGLEEEIQRAQQASVSATQQYNAQLRMVEEHGFTIGETQQGLESGQRAINDLVASGNITKERELELMTELLETIDRSKEGIVDVAEAEKRLKELREGAVASAGSGIDKVAEARRAADEEAIANLNRMLDYILDEQEQLQILESFKEEALQTDEARAAIEERIHNLRVGFFKTEIDETKAAAEARVAAEEQVVDRLKQLTLSQHEYDMELLEKRREEYIELGVDKLEVEKLYLAEKKILDDAEDKRQDEIHEKKMEQFKQAAEYTLQLGVRINDDLRAIDEENIEARKSMQLAALAEIARQELRSAAMVAAKKAIAAAASGKFIEAAKNTAFAAALGIAARGAGSVAEAARKNAELIKKQAEEEAKAREEALKEVEQERIQAPVPVPTTPPRAVAPREVVRAGTGGQTINQDIRMTINGSIFGLNGTEKFIIDTMNKARRLGRF